MGSRGADLAVKFKVICSLVSGPYGDGMNELAWVVSSIVQEVRNQDIEDNTLIVFTSDNGPQLEYCEEGGDPGIFRGLFLFIATYKAVCI